MSDTDLMLLDRWCAGDRQAGSLLYNTHFPAIYQFFENKAAMAAEAEDLVQATFEQFTKSRDRFRRECSVRTYLLAIARNILLQYWRSKQPATRTVDLEQVSLESLTTSIGTRLDDHAERARLLAVLRKLPLDEQLLLEMYYWETRDRTTLAEIFEVEPATIGSRLTRARKALRDKIEETDSELVIEDHNFDTWARSLSGRKSG